MRIFHIRGAATLALAENIKTFPGKAGIFAAGFAHEYMQSEFPEEGTLLFHRTSFTKKTSSGWQLNDIDESKGDRTWVFVGTMYALRRHPSSVRPYDTYLGVVMIYITFNDNSVTKALENSEERSALPDYFPHRLFDGSIKPYIKLDVSRRASLSTIDNVDRRVGKGEYTDASQGNAMFYDILQSKIQDTVRRAAIEHGAYATKVEDVANLEDDIEVQLLVCAGARLIAITNMPELRNRFPVEMDYFLTDFRELEDNPNRNGYLVLLASYGDPVMEISISASDVALYSDDVSDHLQAWMSAKVEVTATGVLTYVQKPDDEA